VKFWRRFVSSQSECSKVNTAAHGFFLGPNCKAVEHARFLKVGVECSLCAVEVDIEVRLCVSDNEKKWSVYEGQSCIMAFKATTDGFTPAKHSKAG
jgi:hypothetical protein